MTRFNITTTDVELARERILEEGVSRACVRHDARPGRYVVIAGEELIPAKVLLAEAARTPCSSFSGGYATTIGVLQRLGFQVYDTKTCSVCPPRKVRDAAKRLETQLRKREPAPLPEGCTAYYLSGTNRAPEIAATAARGHAIGCAAPELSPTSEQALTLLAGTGIQVFVDSGAFSEVSFATGRPVVVNEISHERWKQVLELYARLGRELGEQLTVVAPDRVGDQQVTLQRLRTYGGYLRMLSDLGVRILVPVQKGELDQETFWRMVNAELWDVHTKTPALPCNKSATTPEEAAAFRKAYVGHIHLLGKGPRSRDWQAYVDAMGDYTPNTFSADSCWIGSVTGRRNGPGGGPRVFTAAKDGAKAMLGTACTTTTTTMVALIAALTVAL